jgi:hypothetical protein
MSESTDEATQEAPRYVVEGGYSKGGVSVRVDYESNSQESAIRRYNINRDYADEASMCVRDRETDQIIVPKQAT